MKILNLEQNSPEWYNYRKTRIGASDFNGYCKYIGLYKPYYKITDTLEDHFYNKVNNIQFTNQFIEKGKELEPIILQEYNNLTGGCFVPVVGESLIHNNIFVSLDGYDFFSKRVVEIKTTAKNIICEKELLESYIYQCIHQLNVSDNDDMILIINYYNYGITKYYHIQQIYYPGYFCYKIYYLDLLIIEINIKSTAWERYCEDYLKKLEEFNNE